jgi:hypothetical protein
MLEVDYVVDLVYQRSVTQDTSRGVILTNDP